MGEVDFEKLKRAVRRLGEVEGKKPPRKVLWKLLAAAVIVCAAIAALAVWRPWERGPVEEKVRYAFEIVFGLASPQLNLVENRIDNLIVMGPELKYLPNPPFFENAIDMLSMEQVGWTWDLVHRVGPIVQVSGGEVLKLVPPRTAPPRVWLKIQERRLMLQVDSLYAGEAVSARVILKVSKEIDNAILSVPLEDFGQPLWAGENAYVFFLPSENVKYDVGIVAYSETYDPRLYSPFAWKQYYLEIAPPAWVPLPPIWTSPR